MNEDKVKALRVELKEIYRRFAEGRELPQDRRRAETIAQEIHEMQGGKE